MAVQKKEELLKKIENKKVEIVDLLEKVASKTSALSNTKNPNWATLGSIAHVAELLKELNEFLGEE